MKRSEAVQAITDKFVIIFTAMFDDEIGRRDTEEVDEVLNLGVKLEDFRQEMKNVQTMAAEDGLDAILGASQGFAEEAVSALVDAGLIFDPED